MGHGRYFNGGAIVAGEEKSNATDVSVAYDSSQTLIPDIQCMLLGEFAAGLKLAAQTLLGSAFQYGRVCVDLNAVHDATGRGNV